jgi:hypothetical protein
LGDVALGAAVLDAAADAQQERITSASATRVSQRIEVSRAGSGERREVIAAEQ